MVCYVNGITPSSGNSRTDSIGSNQKTIDLKQFKKDIEKRKLEYEYLKAKERFKKMEEKKLDEKEKEIAKEKEALEKELKKLTLQERIHSMKDSYLFEFYLKAKSENLPIQDMLRDEVLKRSSDLEKSLVPNSMP